jgi:conjugal transfer mating pair stabilization protein TraN
MKKISAVFLLVYFPMTWLCSEESLEKHGKQQVKEDQEWGKEQLKQLLENNLDLAFEKNDVLPEEDKGKEFDANHVNDKEIKSFTGLTTKKEKLEGAESFFQTSRAVLENPEGNVGIISTQSKEVPEEVRLVKCQEAGTYQISFIQKRIVQATPAIKNRVKRCRGHFQLSEYFFWKSSAESELKRVKKELSKDATLESSHANISESSGVKKYTVIAHWKHKDNSSNCPSCTTEEIVVHPPTEEDFWQTDFPKDLIEIESNPNCRLLYSQIVDGPEVRKVDGQSIFRDSWGRQLFFSCEPNAQSPCTELRTQGGTLVKKRCLKENHFGECDLWEKTYDLGKKAASREEIHLFNGDEIWGLNQVFDSSYDKNNDIATAVSTLAIFSDIKKELENSRKELGKDVEIFRGERMQCECSFIQGVIYDCCKKMDGLAVSTYLARCNAEEQALAERRHAGQCHHVGSKKENLKTQTTQVFCCFPTKLARILHEQGREQLGIKWGKADSPKCRGFSLAELQRIDFTKIDLSDAIEDISIDKEELLRKVHSTIDHLQSTGQAEAKMNTDRVVQKQEEIRNGS